MDTGSLSASTAIDKALDVLFALRNEREPLGVTALSQALDMPKSSVHRMLAALMRRSLVERDAHGRYRLGVGLIALGLGALELEPLVAVARPFLEQLAARFGETSFLIAARSGQLVVLDKVEGSGFLRAAPQVGATVPVHATATGKLYLAFAEETLGEARGGGRARYTPATLDGQALEAEVQRVRACGYAVNREEWLVGLSVVAAPVRVGDRLLGVLVTAMPAHQLEVHGEARVAEEVMKHARGVAARLAGEEAEA